MFFTKHAQTRIQQRGKSREAVRLILRYGKIFKKREGVMIRRGDVDFQVARRRRWLARMTKGRKRNYQRAMRKRINVLEKMKGCLVIQEDGKILTVYDIRKRVRHR